MNRIDASLERQRLEALDRYDILDIAPEPQFDDVARRAARICAMPIGIVTLIDGKPQWSKSRIGPTRAEIPRENAFCNTKIGQRDIDAQKQKLRILRRAVMAQLDFGAPIRIGKHCYSAVRCREWGWRLLKENRSLHAS